jgi:hypothetical protein
VEQIGQTEVVLESEFELEEAYAEWHEGVLRADSPAERAMCKRGWDGNESNSWCVQMKRSARKFQRCGEYID